jgi:hypothetical protein
MNNKGSSSKESLSVINMESLNMSSTWVYSLLQRIWNGMQTSKFETYLSTELATWKANPQRSLQKKRLSIRGFPNPLLQFLLDRNASYITFLKARDRTSAEYKTPSSYILLAYFSRGVSCDLFAVCLCLCVSPPPHSRPIGARNDIS